MPLILGMTADWRMILAHLTGELIFKGRPYKNTWAEVKITRRQVTVVTKLRKEAPWAIYG